MIYSEVGAQMQYLVSLLRWGLASSFGWLLYHSCDTGTLILLFLLLYSSALILSDTFLGDKWAQVNETSQDCYPTWVEVFLSKKKSKMAAVAMETGKVWIFLET